MASGPDPTLMAQYCDGFLRPCLVDVCDVPIDEAKSIAEDVLRRAEALSRLDYRDQETIAAPFFEESFDHEPEDASLWLKAITTVVVRNSLLEEPHTRGLVESSGIKALTMRGTAPLSHLKAARNRNPLHLPAADNIFGDLREHYPRAWACLCGVRDLLSERGGRLGYRPPDGLIPDLPGREELAEAATAASVESPSPVFKPILFSAIDPRFDQEAYRILLTAKENPGLILGVSALSRISRNSNKLFRTLEFLLAHRAKILTTNYLLANGEVYVRKSNPIKPVSSEMLADLRDLSGLSGAHRKVAEKYIKDVAKARQKHGSHQEIPER